MEKRGREEEKRTYQSLGLDSPIQSCWYGWCDGSEGAERRFNRQKPREPKMKWSKAGMSWKRVADD